MTQSLRHVINSRMIVRFRRGWRVDMPPTASKYLPKMPLKTPWVPRLRTCLPAYL
ncbi:MAG: hypothetical protein IID28_06800 [Planctomycetes bacterium]|nr:hypothetical protein [Planctomycetota bacterium]